MRIEELPRGGELGREELEALRLLLESGDSLAFGSLRERFAVAFAKSCGAAASVTCNSGTSALWVAAQALGVGPGDEVVVCAQSYRATAMAPLACGARLRFADIDPATLNVSPESLARLVHKGTKAIFVTHYGGNPVDMDPVLDIARTFGVPVVEDAAHAPGAVYRGRTVGSLGDITCFSFHSLKNMTTLGEGGMLTFRDPDLAMRAWRLCNVGVLFESTPRPEAALGPWRMASPPLLDHADGSFERDAAPDMRVGLNLRLTEAQAAVGLVQLDKLAGFNSRRRAVAARYDRLLGELPQLALWQTTPGAESVFHLYPVFLRQASQQQHDDLCNFLHHEKGVTIIQRYFPLHLLNFIRAHGHGPGECPVCEEVFFRQQVNLPIHPGLTEDQTVYVTEALREGLAVVGLT